MNKRIGACHVAEGRRDLSITAKCSHYLELENKKKRQEQRTCTRPQAEKSRHRNILSATQQSQLTTGGKILFFTTFTRADIRLRYRVNKKRTKVADLLALSSISYPG